MPLVVPIRSGGSVRQTPSVREVSQTLEVGNAQTGTLTGLARYRSGSSHEGHSIRRIGESVAYEANPRRAMPGRRAR
jgi:hypothetical protein